MADGLAARRVWGGGGRVGQQGRQRSGAGGLGRGGGFMFMAGWRRWASRPLKYFGECWGAGERSKVWAGRMSALCRCLGLGAAGDCAGTGFALRVTGFGFGFGFTLFTGTSSHTVVAASQSSSRAPGRGTATSSPQKRHRPAGRAKVNTQHPRSGPLGSGQWAVGSKHSAVSTHY
jgi:hypothetical protein